MGGAPFRLLRLSPAGADLVDRWAAGIPVGDGRGERALATRLVAGGLAHPRPGSGAWPLSGRAVVVVPVRDDPDGLGATLTGLASTAPGVDVVVVDDGSEVPVGAEGPGVRILRREVAGGPAAARNTGWLGSRHVMSNPQSSIRHYVAGDQTPDMDSGRAKADVVLFVDAGCVPGPDCWERLLGHLSDPGLAAVAPRVVSRATPATPAGLAAYEGEHGSLDLGEHEGPVGPGARVPYVPTAVLAVRREALEAVGGFDESLRFGEDVDLVWRLHRSGWRIRYEPSARATHPVRASRTGWLRQRYDYGRSATPLAARHGRWVAPAVLSPWTVGAWALAALGRAGPAAAVVTAGTVAAARRAGRDRPSAVELGRQAVLAQGRAGVALGRAVRRAWLPPAAIAGWVAWRLGDRRARAGLALAAMGLVAEPAVDWARRRPALGLLRWVGWWLADDLAYQAGVWSGAIAARSAGALRPRW